MLKLNGIKIKCLHRKHYYSKSYSFNMDVYSPISAIILLAVLMLFVLRFVLMMASGFSAETFQFL